MVSSIYPSSTPLPCILSAADPSQNILQDPLRWSRRCVDAGRGEGKERGEAEAEAGTRSSSSRRLGICSSISRCWRPLPITSQKPISSDRAASAPFIRYIASLSSSLIIFIARFGSTIGRMVLSARWFFVTSCWRCTRCIVTAYRDRITKPFLCVLLFCDEWGVIVKFCCCSSRKDYAATFLTIWNCWLDLVCFHTEPIAITISCGHT